ncbi:MAG: HigA family addiction module antitoxin [Trueperaceae bacterium]
MAMYNPPHPGELLKEECLKPLGLTITEAAQGLGVSRKTLSAIVNGRQGISAEVAIRLAKAFDTSVEMWLSMQQAYDVWQAKEHADLSGVAVLGGRARQLAH